MRFTDKVCLVTGGGSGIGKAACVQFAREGGKVVVVDLNEQHGNETVQEITQRERRSGVRKVRCRRSGQMSKQPIKAAVDKWNGSTWLSTMRQ